MCSCLLCWFQSFLYCITILSLDSVSICSMLTSHIFWFIIICITFSVFMHFSTMFCVLLFRLSDFILLSSEFFLVNFFVVFIIFSKTAAFCMIIFSFVHFFKNILEINRYSSKRKFFMLDKRSSFLTFFLQV